MRHGIVALLGLLVGCAEVPNLGTTPDSTFDTLTIFDTLQIIDTLKVDDTISLLPAPYQGEWELPIWWSDGHYGTYRVTITNSAFLFESLENYEPHSVHYTGTYRVSGSTMFVTFTSYLYNGVTYTGSWAYTLTYVCLSNPTRLQFQESGPYLFNTEGSQSDGIRFFPLALAKGQSTHGLCFNRAN